MSEPDWVYWRQIPETTLWECVALSCSMEPCEKVFGSRAIGYSGGSDHSTMTAEFHDRLGIAISHLGSGGLMAEDNPPNIAHSRIGLSAFAAWAISLDWAPSGDFSSVAKTAESESEDGVGWEGFDPESPAYPKELDIALQAWRAVTNQPKAGVTPKERSNDGSTRLIPTTRKPQRSALQWYADGKKLAVGQRSRKLQYPFFCISIIELEKPTPRFSGNKINRYSCFSAFHTRYKPRRIH